MQLDSGLYTFSSQSLKHQKHFSHFALKLKSRLDLWSSVCMMIRKVVSHLMHSIPSFRNLELPEDSPCELNHTQMVLLNMLFAPLLILQLQCCMNCIYLHLFGQRLFLLLSIFTIDSLLQQMMVLLHFNSCLARNLTSHSLVCLAVCYMCM